MPRTSRTGSYWLGARSRSSSAGYVDLVHARCRARCGQHGEDVAQQVFLRLWRELGRRQAPRGRPFREIVNGVVYFACKGGEGAIFAGDAPLDEECDAVAAGSRTAGREDVIAVLDARGVRRLATRPGTARLLDMRILEGREIADIAKSGRQEEERGRPGTLPDSARMEEMARELTDPTLELLEEFTAAWLRGETPDPREVLDRAPENERAELSALIERFLVRQPSREADGRVARLRPRDRGARCRHFAGDLRSTAP